MQYASNWLARVLGAKKTVAAIIRAKGRNLIDKFILPSLVKLCTIMICREQWKRKLAVVKPKLGKMQFTEIPV